MLFLVVLKISVNKRNKGSVFDSFTEMREPKAQEASFLLDFREYLRHLFNI